MNQSKEKMITETEFQMLSYEKQQAYTKKYFRNTNLSVVSADRNFVECDEAMYNRHNHPYRELRYELNQSEEIKPTPKQLKSIENMCRGFKLKVSVQPETKEQAGLIISALQKVIAERKVTGYYDGDNNGGDYLDPKDTARF